MMRSILIGLTMLVAAPAAAQNAKHDPIINFSEDDVEMNAAKAEARRTLPAFFAKLANPAADERDFFLKYDLDPQGGTEFIWANEISVDGDAIQATLANAPMREGYALGHRVTIARALIIDWGYVKRGVTQGHYTTRVLLKKMPADEAAAVRAALGW